MKNNISWDEYFMGIAMLSALRSKDPNTKVGACIVDKDNKVVSIGYNGMPCGVPEDELSWNRGEGLDSKYLYVCHAEFNAILNTNTEEKELIEKKPNINSKNQNDFSLLFSASKQRDSSNIFHQLYVIENDHLLLL